MLHLILDGIANEAVQTLSLTGSESFDYIPLPFLDDDINSVICLFIVSGSGFFLRIGILHGDTSFVYILPQVDSETYNYTMIFW